jgi:hypothetical protein
MRPLGIDDHSRGRNGRRRLAASLRGLRAPAAILWLVSAGCTTGNPIPVEKTSSTAVATRAEQLRTAGRDKAAADTFQEAARRAGLEGERGRQAEYQLAAGEAYLRCNEQSLAWLALSAAKNTLTGHPTSSTRRSSGLLRANTGLGDLDLMAGRLDNARRHYADAVRYARGPARDSLEFRLSLVAELEGDAVARELHRARVPGIDSRDYRTLRLALLGTRAGSLPDAAPAERWSPPPTTRGPVGPTKIYPRGSWAASRTKANVDPMGRIWRITIHHTGDYFSDRSLDGTARCIQGIQRHHMNNNGWADIGYHYLIDPAGRIWEGRPLGYQGAHAGNPGLNQGNVGIALLGDFNTQSLSGAQVMALESLIASLTRRYRIPANEIHTHQEIRPTATECPGTNIQRNVQRIRRDALASSGGGTRLSLVARSAP